MEKKGNQKKASINENFGYQPKSTGTHRGYQPPTGQIPLKTVNGPKGGPNIKKPEKK